MPVTVKMTSDGYTSQVSTGSHELLADEPASVGGDDKGPSPYEFLLASLGACTTMTLRMYADRKDWPLPTVTVELNHYRVHAKDCEDCESEEGMVSRIDRRLTIEGEYTDEQRKRLVEIAEKCPVHKTLVGEVKIDTTLVDA